MIDQEWGLTEAAELIIEIEKLLHGHDLAIVLSALGMLCSDRLKQADQQVVHYWINNLLTQVPVEINRRQH